MQRNDAIEALYCRGQCYPMAIALHRRLGWPIRTLTALRDRSSRAPHPAHFWVEAPDGRAFDASGFRSEGQILEEYLSNRTQFTIDSAQIAASESEDQYLNLILDLAGGGEEFEAWYKDRLVHTIPEAERAIDEYLEPRYAPSALNQESTLVDMSI